MNYLCHAMETVFNRIRPFAAFLSRLTLLLFLLAYCWKNIESRADKTSFQVSFEAEEHPAVNLHYAPAKCSFQKFLPLLTHNPDLSNNNLNPFHLISVLQPQFCKTFFQNNFHLLSFINAP
jgi:hypothetical protein